MEHVHAARNIKMSAAELADLQGATAATHAELVRQLVASGKFNWQAFPSEVRWGGIEIGGKHVAQVDVCC